MTEITIEKIIPLLTPLAPRIHHLEIGMDENSQTLLQSLLECILRLGAYNSLQRLDLWYNADWALFGADSDRHLYLDPWYEPYRSERGKDKYPVANFLESVRQLRVRSVDIPHDHKAYHALTELSLCDVDLSIQVLGSILAASPMLQTLCLRELKLDYDDTPTESIPLSNLRSLTLGPCSMGPDEIICLLPILKPGSHSLHVHLSLRSVDSSVVENIRGFFSRSSVTDLHIKVDEPNSWFGLLRLSLNQLETLTLEACNLRDSDLIDFLESEPRNKAPWPKLRALHLVDCWIDRKILRDLLTMNPVQVFRFIDRREPVPIPLTLARPDRFGLKLLQEEISEYVTDAKCLGPWLYESRGPIPSFMERMRARGF
ncbi:hypothetical protein BDV93DRAFT_612348 [Ceratobasidium sp. AG-I]|nr:hypothetical protein BDV93DRAFT_612348 [Ceratobasidium sp. AG-I]